MTLRRRAAVELAVLAALTALYLALVPVRPIWVDLGLALVALSLVALTARQTREQFWPPPAAPHAVRLRHCARHMLIGTLAVTLLFALVGAGWGAARLARPTLALALVLFVPWAWLQQALFQFYLLGRIRALLPGASAPALAALNGLLFGLVHLPDAELTVLTIIAGAVWSWYYLRDRCLAPIALSHAVLGTTYYYWVRNHDLVGRWLGALG